eukprot:COSAG02_NODE_2094_length_9849_cov_9.775282_1_plen_598_part_00
MRMKTCTAPRRSVHTCVLASLWSLLLSLLASAGALDRLFGSLREPVCRSWQRSTVLLRSDEQQPSWEPEDYFVSSSELDWTVFSGIGLEEGRPLDFGETDLKLVRRYPGDLEQGEPWLQSLAWRRVVNNRTASSSQHTAHGHGTALDVIHGAFDHGFSVVINLLNHRLAAVGAAALELSNMLGFRVNANLYLTPSQTAGFEPHFDWMESIIVQLEGTKRWRIFEPIVQHPRPRQKFKPHIAELGQPVQTVELKRGDMLYLPAGIPHECEAVGAEPSLHVTFGAEVDEDLSWAGALLTLWDVYIAAQGEQSQACGDSIRAETSSLCAPMLPRTVAIAATVYAAAEHEPLLRRGALPFPRSLRNQTLATARFVDELLQMARRVLAFTGGSTVAGFNAPFVSGLTLEAVSPQGVLQDGWAWVTALARSAASKNFSTASKGRSSRLGLTGLVEVDSDARPESLFADRRNQLELAAQRCADDLRVRAAARDRTSIHGSNLSESELRLALQHLGGNGSGERVEPDQTAHSALQTLVLVASDENAAAQTFQALLASRDAMLQQAAYEQSNSLRQHAFVHNDLDFIRAWQDYQEQRSSRPAGRSG